MNKVTRPTLLAFINDKGITPDGKTKLTAAANACFDKLGEFTKF